MDSPATPPLDRETDVPFGRPSLPPGAFIVRLFSTCNTDLEGKAPALRIDCASHLPPNSANLYAFCHVKEQTQLHVPQSHIRQLPRILVLEGKQHTTRI